MESQVNHSCQLSLSIQTKLWVPFTKNSKKKFKKYYKSGWADKIMKINMILKDRCVKCIKE